MMLLYFSTSAHDAHDLLHEIVRMSIRISRHVRLLRYVLASLFVPTFPGLSLQATKAKLETCELTADCGQEREKRRNRRRSIPSAPP
jgi:ubiquinone biosynthesis protein Coq4